MRVLIYGAGVIGSIFAGRLAASGKDVTVLARGRRLEELRHNGVVLSKPGAHSDEIIPVNIIEQLAPDDSFDYILVVMQRTQVDSILPILARNCSKNIVFVVNTAGGYEKWAKAIGSERLMIAFPSAGGERIGSNVVYFIGKGILRAFQTTTFGEYNGRKTERVRQLITAFNLAGIPSVFCDDMDSWQKTHVAMVTSIANALYQFDCDNYRLAKSYESVCLMLHGIKEGFAVLHALGIKTRPSKLWYMKLPVGITARVFRVVLKTKLAETTMAKHCIVATAEMSCLQAEFDTLIMQSHMQTPSIDRLRENLSSFENKKNL
ncbi:ketopantoate reductase [Sphaerochaeta pleomorpha str. Grapes]|uniref:Ketopantoate reductase n=1 Tax=Sphaerochaeta pleomorpha (strain ATCC BAA-1885 / DSM 22778 / Grapes) TaxID=158190 RepID=G8QXK1_SPHPG|nr:2-dehydropantoate 2-reductase N-terminal domain-containing protein [Sphaerochaeta pleomorpha]AEV29564.1 ketopantoate reductase [Sphaerochaeta pleomorpha str. Grapes]